VIAFPRSLAKQFRSVLRHLGGPSDRSHTPVVLLRSSGKGLTLECVLNDTAIRLEYPGRQTREVMAFSAMVLAQIEGKSDDPVSIEEINPGTGRASWSVAGSQSSIDFNTVKPEKHLFFPEPPDDMRSPGEGFRAAMHDATQAAASEITGRGVHQIQLRGSTGQIIATDGRQLLIQGGFAFPWRNDLLVPRINVWASRELPEADEVTLALTNTHLFVRIGAWTFALKTDTHGRFPAAEQVVPSPRGIRTRLQLGAEDIALLCKELPRFSRRKDEPAHVVLEIDKEVVARIHSDDQEQAIDLKLTGSQATGQPVSVMMYHHNLVHALKLGFSKVEIVQATTPLCCRDDKRVYVWVPLAEPVAEKARPATPAEINKPPEKEEPTMPEPNNKHAGNDNDVPSPNGVIDPLTEAEAVKSLLTDAQLRVNRLIATLKQFRKQSRAVAAAVQSLRQLPPLAP
jgi:hypothetical protein